MNANSKPMITAAWVLVVLLLGSYFFLQIRPLLGDRETGVLGLASHANDYKHLYLGSKILLDGESPYEAERMLTLAGSLSRSEDPRFRTILPYVYPPFTGLLLSPLSIPRFHQSVVAFQIINHAVLLAGLLLVALAASGQTIRTTNPWIIAGCLAAVAFNSTVLRQNNAGQLNVLLFGGMALLYFGWVRGWHDGALGSLAAALALLKLTPGIFLILWLLRGEYRKAAWMLAACFVYTIITVLWVGLPVHLDFLPVLRDMGYGKSTWQELGNTFWRDPYNQSFNGLWHRLLVPHEGSGITSWAQASPALANAITWLCTAAILALFFLRTWTQRTRATATIHHAVALAVCVSLLVPSIMWDHYLVQALLPGIILWFHAPQRWKRVLLLIALAITCAPIPLDRESFRQGAGLLLMSIKLVPVLLLFLLAALPPARATLPEAPATSP